MGVVAQLNRLGGVASRAALIEQTSRAEVDRALKEGAIVGDAPGRYAVPAAEASQRAANAMSAVVSHRSAALRWGWPLARVPEMPEVIVPRNRNVPAESQRVVKVRWAALEPDDVVGGLVTSPKRTLVDCLRSLPFDEALAVADSALRLEALDEPELVAVAASVRGKGAPQARRAAAEATGLAANPFESVLRAVALDVPGLDVAPQVMIRARNFSVQPDLVDEERRIVLEADSFAWHGDRQALRWDAQRYDNLVVRGWLVLRFAWEDVMHDQDYVRRTLTMLSRLVAERAHKLESLPMQAEGT